MKVLGEGATILGFDLRTLVKDLRVPPTIVSTLAAGELPGVRMSWTWHRPPGRRSLRGPGGPEGPASLDLTVETLGVRVDDDLLDQAVRA